MTPELGPVEFCVITSDGSAPVQEMDEANPDKTALGLTLVDEEARVANYKGRRR